jgi:hypothetical protein
MGTDDLNAGPQICQPVLHNHSGTMTAAMIYAVNAAAGTVSLVWFGSGGATSVTGVSYSPGAQTSGTYRYARYF